jgi:hypothetical protein
MGMYQDPNIMLDKTLQDVRDVFYAWLEADPERDPDLDFNYAGSPIPMAVVMSRLKQERFVEDTLQWEEQLFEDEKALARDLGSSEEDIAKMQKWESPLRKQVQISLKKTTYPLMRLWRKGPDFIFDLFRSGTDKGAYQKAVAARKKREKGGFEEEIAEDERVDEGDYEGPSEISAESDLDF